MEELFEEAKDNEEEMEEDDEEYDDEPEYSDWCWDPNIGRSILLLAVGGASTLFLSLVILPVLAVSLAKAEEGGGGVAFSSLSKTKFNLLGLTQLVVSLW